MSKIDPAENMPYWQTTVHPARSQGEIVELLENFGAENIMLAQGTSAGRYAWVIRFGYLGRTYRFVFTPLSQEHPDKMSKFSGKQRDHATQARWQMGRVAVHFTKAILTAAEMHPHALFGFLEIQAPGTTDPTLRMTAGDLPVDGLVSMIKLPLPPQIEGGQR